MFVTGTTWRKKCPVAPDSDIACDLFMWGLVFVCFYIYWCLLPLSFISYEVIGASYEDFNQLPVADFSPSSLPGEVLERLYFGVGIGG